MPSLEDISFLLYFILPFSILKMIESQINRVKRITNYHYPLISYFCQAVSVPLLECFSVVAKRRTWFKQVATAFRYNANAAAPHSLWLLLKPAPAAALRHEWRALWRVNTWQAAWLLWGMQSTVSRRKRMFKKIVFVHFPPSGATAMALSLTDVEQVRRLVDGREQERRIGEGVGRSDWPYSAGIVKIEEGLVVACIWYAGHASLEQICQQAPSTHYS